MAGVVQHAVIELYLTIKLNKLIFTQFEAIKNNYTDSCKNSTDCDITIGLICANIAGSCNCPVMTVTNMCDCPNNNFYYKYSSTQCGKNEFLFLKLKGV